MPQAGKLRSVADWLYQLAPEEVVTTLCKPYATHSILQLVINCFDHEPRIIFVFLNSDFFTCMSAAYAAPAVTGKGVYQQNG
jgi:hypothetical protein